MFGTIRWPRSSADSCISNVCQLTGEVILPSEGVQIELFDDRGAPLGHLCYSRAALKQYLEDGNETDPSTGAELSANNIRRFLEIQKSHQRSSRKTVSQFARLRKLGRRRRLTDDMVFISRGDFCSKSKLDFLTRKKVPKFFVVCVSVDNGRTYNLFDVRNLHRFVQVNKYLPTGENAPPHFMQALTASFPDVDFDRGVRVFRMPESKTYICEEGDTRPGCDTPCEGEEGAISMETIEDDGVRLVSNNVGRCYDKKIIDMMLESPGPHLDPFTRLAIDPESIKAYKRR